MTQAEIDKEQDRINQLVIQHNENAADLIQAQERLDQERNNNEHLFITGVSLS